MGFATISGAVQVCQLGAPISMRKTSIPREYIFVLEYIHTGRGYAYIYNVSLANMNGGLHFEVRSVLYHGC